MGKVSPIQFAEIKQHTCANSQGTDLISEIIIESNFLKLLGKLFLEQDGTETEDRMGKGSDHEHPDHGNEYRDKIAKKRISIT